MTRCIIPGSFDPVTVGHYDIIKTMSERFDEVFAVVFANSEKTYMFDDDKRLSMLECACRNFDNVKTDISSELVVDYAKSRDIHTIVKGVRSNFDFEYEQRIAMINRELCPDIETLLYPACPENIFISSSFVREMIKYGKDVSSYIPKYVKIK